jgi:hypothetical protein
MGPLLPVAHSTKDVSFTSCPARKELGRKPFFYSFRGPDGNSPDSSLILDSAGNLYGTTAGEALTAAVLRSS